MFPGRRPGKRWRLGPHCRSPQHTAGRTRESKERGAASTTSEEIEHHEASLLTTAPEAELNWPALHWVHADWPVPLVSCPATHQPRSTTTFRRRVDTNQQGTGCT